LKANCSVWHRILDNIVSDLLGYQERGWFAIREVSSCFFVLCLLFSQEPRQGDNICIDGLGANSTRATTDTIAIAIGSHVKKVSAKGDVGYSRVERMSFRVWQDEGGTVTSTDDDDSGG